jgi:glycerophosphoryl diester phosphodiesterase
MCSTTDAADLAGMDAGAWFGKEYRGEPVPLFADFIAYCKAHGIWMNIEIKPAPGAEAQTGAVVAAATRANCSKARRRRRRCCRRSATWRWPPPNRPRRMWRAPCCSTWSRATGCIARARLGGGIHTNHKHLTAAVAREIRPSGFGLFCYTVNNPIRARELLMWGVDGFCTDRIDLIGPDFA